MSRACALIAAALCAVDALNVRESVVKEDIFINGHPKTGTTWMTLIVQNILTNRCNATSDCKMFAGEMTSEGQSLHMLSKKYDITFAKPTKDTCCEGRGLKHVIHEGRGLKHVIPSIGYGPGWSDSQAPELTDSQISEKVAFVLKKAPATQKWVVVFRDPRDTVLSACHHFAAQNCTKQPFRAQFAREKVRSVASWENVRYRFFKNMVQSHPERAIIFFFEDMKEDTLKQIGRVGTFVGMPLTPAEKKAVQTATSLKRVKKARKELIPFHDSKYKLREGNVCGFQKELNAEDARAVTGVMRRALSPELNDKWTC